MVKSLLEFNRDYDYRCYIEDAGAAKALTKGSVIRSSIFYAVLVSAVIFSFIWSGGKESGKRFGPFAYNTVLTGSMQSVYPQGSLVTSWELGLDDALKAGLSGGDDIVFVTEDGRVVVHRIIEIYEDYEDSGQRGFKTQGVDNPAPDPWTVYEGHIIGRVTWHLPYAGNILGFISDKLLWFIGGIVGLFALSALLKIILAKEQSSPKTDAQTPGV